MVTNRQIDTGFEKVKIFWCSGKLLELDQDDIDWFNNSPQHVSGPWRMPTHKVSMSGGHYESNQKAMDELVSPEYDPCLLLQWASAKFLNRPPSSKTVLVGLDKLFHAVNYADIGLGYLVRGRIRNPTSTSVRNLGQFPTKVIRRLKKIDQQAYTIYYLIEFTDKEKDFLLPLLTERLQIDA